MPKVVNIQKRNVFHDECGATVEYEGQEVETYQDSEGDVSYFYIVCPNCKNRIKSKTRKLVDKEAK